MLQTLLAYARGVGVDARSGSSSKATPSSSRSRSASTTGCTGCRATAARSAPPSARHYEETLRPNAAELRVHVRPGDFVLLHDPQTAALAPELRELRCDTWCGAATSGSTTRTSTRSGPGTSCGPTSRTVDAYVFSCEQFAPPWIDRDRLEVIPPSIDPFSAKNEPMDAAEVIPHPAVRRPDRRRATDHRSRPSRAATGRPGASTATSTSSRPDRRRRSTAPLVLQASRWDSLKDMRGRHGGVRRARRARRPTRT